MIASISSFFNAFFEGELDSTRTHAVLLLVSIICEALVAVGILMETHWPRTLKDWLAAIFIIGGVFFGAVATISLFVFDEAVSASQQRRIKALDLQVSDTSTSATNANNKVIDLLKENMELERALAPRIIDRQAFLARLKNVEKVEVIINWKSDEEPAKTARALYNAFEIPAWSVSLQSLEPYKTDLYQEGITIQYAVHATAKGIEKNEQGEKAAVAICRSLKAQNINVAVLPMWTDFKPKTEEWPLPLSGVIIHVGAKPNLFWTNKMLRENGGKDMPDFAFCSVEELWNQAIEQRKSRSTP